MLNKQKNCTNQFIFIIWTQFENQFTVCWPHASKIMWTYNYKILQQGRTQLRPVRRCGGAAA